ncbi:MAG: ABC transporter ATP-binding protein [Anaerolineae bacterium]|nr:ABC transporter ATP-binding protein [Anaerolineae bacterium]
MIEIERLTKRFGDLTAVDAVSLTVDAGEVLALLGPNGAGKTTTVRMLSAVLRPTAGRASVAGYDVVGEAPEVRRRVGVLTEAPGLYTRMSGREYLDFFGQLRGLSKSYLTARVEMLAAQFRMVAALDRRLSEYSKGMRQKIALIRTLLHDPPVLLLDEPTSAMDPASARLVRDALHRLRQLEGRAILVCTHNLPEAEELSDRIAIIRQGRIVAEGTPADLKQRLLGPPLMELRVVVGPQNGVRDVVDRHVTVEAAGEGWVRYRTADPAATNPALVAALSRHGVGVLTLSEVPQSLESVYLLAVGEETDASI